MKLRIILVVLSVLSFLSVSVAGYVYYASLRASAFREAESDSAVQAERIRNAVSSFLSENLRTVKALGGLEEMGRALASRDEASLARANALLDHFQDALKADVCYLMDGRGITVASSNRNAPDSFVGKNFAFRPYWRQAIRGTPATYMGLGVTSNVRGAYYSHPVPGEAGSPPAGVVVIKVPVERIEEEFRRGFEGIVLLADPHGIVFASSRKEWLSRSLRPLSPETQEEIALSQQFGPGPWEGIGLEIRTGNVAADGEGREYLVRRMEIGSYPGWSVIYLRDLRDITRAIAGPLVRSAGSIILALCVLIGLSVVFLYKRASDDIVRRRKAEEALEEAKGELKRYSRELERQVKERTREIRSILKNTPAVVYIKDREGRYTYVNPRFEALFGVRDDAIRGRTDYDVFPSEFALRYRGNDRLVFAGERPIQVEEPVPQGDGVHVYLSAKFPLQDEEGATAAVCGISIDITEIRKAQDQMRRLSDSIIAGQERERAAVSRELHDELGQVLTALRLDSAWLRERLRAADDDASSRAGAMCGLIDQAIDEVRGMATRLRPGALDKLGLVDALDWYFRDFEKRTGTACVFRHADVPAVDDRTATAAYRIAQESLTNVVRHSAASRVDVSLRAEGGVLTLSVEDDGRGFDVRELAEAEGLGVAGMRERAALVGGTLEILSRPGGGTQVVLRIPAGGAEGAPA